MCVCVSVCVSVLKIAFVCHLAHADVFRYIYIYHEYCDLFSFLSFGD